MANRSINHLGSVETIKLPVSQSVTIEQGDLVAVNSTGNAILCTDAASIKFVGVNTRGKVDNSTGANGDKFVYADNYAVFSTMAFSGSVTNASLGVSVYATSNSKLVSIATGSNSIKVGTLVSLPLGVTSSTTGSVALGRASI